MAQWLRDHDIVVLTEIKRANVTHAPGFVPVVAKNSSSQRGGVVVMFKHDIYDDVTLIDTTAQEQIWFQLQSVPGVMFGGAYIPPSDSPFFSDVGFSEIQVRSQDNTSAYVVVGDMNTRCGDKVKELIEGSNDMYYKPVDETVNSNGKSIIQVCKDNNLLVVNNLHTASTSFPSSLTYRKKKKWISEVDYCLISARYIRCVKNFEVNQNTVMPSDHAPVSIDLEFSEEMIDAKILLQRAQDLCGHFIMNHSEKSCCRKPVPFVNIDVGQFALNLSALDMPSINLDQSPDDMAMWFTESLYNCAVQSRQAIPRPQVHTVEALLPRWQRILECEDAKTLWRAIDWRGQFSSTPKQEMPSEYDFQEHMERLLDPPAGEGENLLHVEDYEMNIPLLDDPITTAEVQHVIDQQLKPGKGAGPDGVSPGLFRLLPGEWMMFLCTLVNSIFVMGYPTSWTPARLIMLFKKGNPLNCDNYRGISVINSAAKLYDYVLNNRLMAWYKPFREQAGAQPKRGCIEHIVALRLLIEYSVRNRVKLYIAFIDFSKAYDRVPRGKLFKILKSLGCGATMSLALMSMYRVTTSILGSTTITASIGVRQGSPTSCFLFVLFVDMLIRKIKLCGDDGFLKWLHVLMLMDDTVILATSRERLSEKLKCLQGYCDEYGMVLNEDKTNFMVILGSDKDRQPIQLGSFVVRHCDSYTYLGAIFTADGKARTSLALHVKEKTKHLNKLMIFLSINYDAPFCVKLKVFEAAFSSAVLYGCESWFKVPLKPVESLYMTAVKSLLGVRSTTPNLTCLIEAGLPSVQALVREKQRRFLIKMQQRHGMLDDPLWFVLEMTRKENKVMMGHLTEIVETLDNIDNDRRKMVEMIQAKEGTRYRTYQAINPDMSVHPLYTSNALYVEDHLRITFTRFRLSAHRLRVEMGRWSRTPPEQRVCSCKTGIQNEEHILVCPLTQEIRTKYGHDSIQLSSIFVNTNKIILVMLHACLSVIEHQQV